MLTFKDLDQLFKVAFYAYGENGRNGLPLFFVSPPGEAKTSKARAFARDSGAWFGSMEGSRLDAVDVAGLPKFSADDRSFVFVPPKILRDAADAGAGLLFLDELTRAPGSVQAAFLTLLLEGRTEGVQLPPGVRIWAAANPAAQVGGVDLDPANASRLVWVDWPQVTADEWVAYLLNADAATGDARAVVIDHAAETARLETLWHANMGRARGVVAGFMSAQGSRIREASPEQARGWANPRTWSMATRALAASFMHDASDTVRTALLSGCIGAGTAHAFLTWQRNMDLPDAREVLARRAQLPVNPRRRDQTLATLSECIAIATTDGAQVERLWELCKQAGEVSFELAIVGVRMLQARGGVFITSRNPHKMALLTNQNMTATLSMKQGTTV